MSIQAAVSPAQPGTAPVAVCTRSPGDELARDAMSPALVARLDQLEMLTLGDFANVVRQRDVLGEALTPEKFLCRLIVECRYKEGLQAAA